MNWVLIGLGFGTAGGATLWALKLRKKLTQIRHKYSPIIDVEKYIKDEKEKLAERLQQADEEFALLCSKSESARYQLKKDLEDLEEQYKEAKTNLAEVEQKLDLAREEFVLQDYGYYEPSYSFDSGRVWDEELKLINTRLKGMLRNVQHNADRSDAWNTCAGYIVQVISFNGSEPKGIRMQKETIKLLLRAFNGECDSFIAKVTYKNISTMRKRLESSFEAINKIGDTASKVKISQTYKHLKERELIFLYEYEEWKQKEKEEQERIREQIRQEEREAKENERILRELEKEAKRDAAALAKARSEVEGANEKQKLILLAQIAELEQRMQEMEEKNRYISQAMLTKTGHVYIISNVGSFGDKVLKIGMTRRLDPMDRVKELGDASVPFPFDVHAMIRTSDAPSLENALHKHFEERRVNLENTRKEFFYVTVDEIKQELNQLKKQLNIEAEIHITMAAEAKQWRLSEAKRRHLQRSYEK